MVRPRVHVGWIVQYSTVQWVGRSVLTPGGAFKVRRSALTAFAHCLSPEAHRM